VGSTATPHDALFKAGFENPEHAAALFRQVLPPAVVAALDWSTIQREPASFIGPTLAARHGDLLFSVRLRVASDVRVLLYLMLEDQSLTQVRGWERYRKDHRTGPLPVIIPIVISHDPDGWSAPKSFHALFDLGPLGALDSFPELAQFVPSFELRVEDLMEIDNEQLLRDARSPERVLECFPEWVELVRQLVPTPNSHVEIEQAFRYILQVAGELRFAEFLDTIRQQLPRTEEIVMTIADQLRAEGEAKGRAEGEAKGRSEGEAKGRLHTLVKLMTLKFGALSAEHAAVIEAATEQQLDVYIERILSAPSPAAVLRGD
jgi:predicted transposase YdaD